MELIELTFNKIMQSKAYTVFILGNEKKKFAIYAEARVGEQIQEYMKEAERSRPLTHDLLQSLFKGLDITPLQIVITEVQDSIYKARLFLEQTLNDQKTIVEIDARPSDCLTIALMNNLPIYAAKQVMKDSLPVEK